MSPGKWAEPAVERTAPVVQPRRARPAGVGDKAAPMSPAIHTVELRKHFIVTNAKDVRFLDI